MLDDSFRPIDAVCSGYGHKVGKRDTLILPIHAHELPFLFCFSQREAKSVLRTIGIREVSSIDRPTASISI